MGGLPWLSHVQDGSEHPPTDTAPNQIYTRTTCTSGAALLKRWVEDTEGGLTVQGGYT
jgi:hypothetical protein